MPGHLKKRVRVAGFSSIIKLLLEIKSAVGIPGMPKGWKAKRIGSPIEGEWVINVDTGKPLPAPKLRNYDGVDIPWEIQLIIERVV